MFPRTPAGILLFLAGTAIFIGGLMARYLPQLHGNLWVGLLCAVLGAVVASRFWDAARKRG